MWDLSCRDWETRILAGKSLIPTLPLIQSEADIAVQFFDGLRLPDVPGQPLLADAAGDWFRGIVAALFGSYDPAENVRHIREIFGLVGKGNSKTSYGAGLMVTALLMNRRPRAEFLIVAPTQAIADLAFSQAVGMIEADPELLKRFAPVEHTKQIKDRVYRSKLKVKTFALDILTGPKPAGVLLDELHLLGRNAITGKVLRQIRGGIEKNPEGFLVMISTQSDEQPTGAFREELVMARSIRDGSYKGRMLPVLYEFPKGIAEDEERWSDPANWPIVMPNLGRSLQLPSLIQDFAAEKTKGDHAIRVWASQHLNIEIGLGLKADRWAGTRFWERRADKSLTLDALIERSEIIVVGIDGGGLDDLLAVSFIGREIGTRRWLCVTRAWCKRCVLEERKSIASKLLDLEKEGALKIIDNESDEDVRDVVDLVELVDNAGLLAREAAIGVDQIGLPQIVDELELRGFKVDEGDGKGRVIGVRQGFSLSNQIKGVERRLASGDMIHDGTELMLWAIGNAKVVPRGNALTIEKQTAGTAKIDPMMAMLDAAVLMSKNPSATRSVYEDEDFLV